MLKVYFTIIRPILEYAVPVWQAIPEYLSHKIESVQRRALKIIKPGEESYDKLLQLLNVEKLQARREKLCKQYMDKIKTPNHLLNALIHVIENMTIASETTIGTFISLIIELIVEQSYVVISLLINTISFYRYFYANI